MIRLWLFLHLLGFTMWLGGALAAMIGGIAAKREDRSGLGAIVRSQAAMHRALIGPGAILTVLSGLILTFSTMGGPAGGNVWLMVMQGAGIVGALLVLLVSMPAAVRLSRLDPNGPHAAHFDALRQRQRVVGSIAGVLGLLALLAGAMLRYGG